MEEELEKNYITVIQLANIIGDGANSEIRRIQRRVKSLLEYDSHINIEVYKGVNYIHKTLISKFGRVYKKQIQKPDRDLIINSEWDIFGDYVPEGRTNEDVLVSVMEELEKELIKRTKKPLKIFFAIEKQPNAHKHVHYMIQSPYGKRNLINLIEETIDIYCLSNQYIKKFNNEMVVNATNYFLKGIGVNFKNAIFISSRITVKGIRR